MGDEADVGSALANGHPEGICHQLRAQVIAHRPADDPAREDVLDDGQVAEARGPHSPRFRGLQISQGGSFSKAASDH